MLYMYIFNAALRRFAKVFNSTRKINVFFYCVAYKWSVTYMWLNHSRKTITNKAIRDGKYLARHMPVLGNVHPIKIENVDIFFVTSFLCSLELLYY